MKAIVLRGVHNLREETNPLFLEDLPIPKPENNEVLLKVLACGICHTEIDEIEGRTPPNEYPRIPGHEVVGRIIESRSSVAGWSIGDRVGVGWFHSSCGKCRYCLEGNENLCSHFRATGRDADGGYAEYMKVPASSVFPIPSNISDVEAAPLLCAGAIGYRSLRLADIKDGDRLGLTGFGGSAHLVLKMVGYLNPNCDVFVFARNEDEREYAVRLGAAWAGDTAEKSPEKLDSIIDTTPAWKPVVEALGNLAPEGRLVLNAIRKEDFDKEYLFNLSYPEHLWMEKEIKSVANVSIRDIREFLELAGRMDIHPDVTEYALEDANKALVELKTQKVIGAKVLRGTSRDGVNFVN